MPLNGKDLYWRQEVTIPAGQTSAPIIFPAGIRHVTVSLHPGAGGSGKVQHSTGDQNLIESNPTGQRWVDWDAGVVTAAKTLALLTPVSAVRGVATTQPAVLEVIGYRPQ